MDTLNSLKTEIDCLKQSLGITQFRITTKSMVEDLLNINPKQDTILESLCFKRDFLLCLKTGTLEIEHIKTFQRIYE
jgi:hypothetical protein